MHRLRGQKLRLKLIEHAARLMEQGSCDRERALRILVQGQAGRIELVRRRSSLEHLQARLRWHLSINATHEILLAIMHHHGIRLQLRSRKQGIQIRRQFLTTLGIQFRHRPPLCIRTLLAHALLAPNTFRSRVDLGNCIFNRQMQHLLLLDIINKRALFRSKPGTLHLLVLLRRQNFSFADFLLPQQIKFAPPR